MPVWRVVYTAPMSAPLLGVVEHPLSVEALSQSVAAEAAAIAEGYGALASFVGVVRATHAGRRVRYLEYEAFVPLAEKVFSQIAAEVRSEFPETVLGLVHRTGRLDVGEASVVIVAAAAHRQLAFAACRYAIERVKQIAPVWKHEYFEGGDAWVEGALADPADAEARRAARERACV
jgi:molybdopterin synthase catalytic subunit